MWRIDCYMRRYAWWRKWRGLPEPTYSPVIDMIAREALALLSDPATFRTGGADKPLSEGKMLLRVRMPNQYTTKS